MPVRWGTPGALRRRARFAARVPAPPASNGEAVRSVCPPGGSVESPGRARLRSPRLGARGNCRRRRGRLGPLPRPARESGYRSAPRRHRPVSAPAGARAHLADQSWDQVFPFAGDIRAGGVTLQWRTGATQERPARQTKCDGHVANVVRYRPWRQVYGRLKVPLPLPRS